MTTSLALRITHLEAELAAYRDAFQSLMATKVELAASIEGQPTREQLVIQLATLREALQWCFEVGGFEFSRVRLSKYLKENP